MLASLALATAGFIILGLRLLCHKCHCLRRRRLWPGDSVSLPVQQKLTAKYGKCGLSFVSQARPRVTSWRLGCRRLGGNKPVHQFAFGLCAVLMVVAFGLITSLQNVNYGVRTESGRMVIVEGTDISQRQGGHGMKADGRAFVGESGSGHAVVMQSTPEAGGRDPWGAPHGNAAHWAWRLHHLDVVMILEKGSEKLTSCEINLDGERAAEEPKVFHPREDDLPPAREKSQAIRTRHQAFRREILFRHSHVPPHRNSESVWMEED